nr:hypothetical protein CFP56_34033 [Quercus suber]
MSMRENFKENVEQHPTFFTADTSSLVPTLIVSPLDERYKCSTDKRAKRFIEDENAKVVCLGSWPGAIEYYIEEESTEFLNGLTSSKELSLQGISLITELPNSIGKHNNLLILDLRERHNLKVLPKEIAQLMNLKYLDLSDC